MNISGSGTTLAELRRSAPLIVILALTGIAYIPGLFGGFIFDDNPNIVTNGLLRADHGSLFHWVVAAFSSNAGVLRRPISMLSFALNNYLFGMQPLPFKVVNVLIHLLNGVLACRLSALLVPRLLSRNQDVVSRRLALLVAAVWLLHPLHVSNVIYIVQRMNELSALFTLLGLLCYVEGRLRVLSGGRGWFTSIGGLITFGILAAFSKENGVLIAGYALVVEAVCFRFETGDSFTRKQLKSFFALVVVAPCVLFLTFLLMKPHWLPDSYAGRDFTLVQRLLTEPRVLLHYLLWVFVPWPAWMGLYHDDIQRSSGWLSPWTTPFAVLALVAVAILAWSRRRQNPGLSFAVAWFLVGHSMESTLLPLEFTFEHRNYLPMLGLLLGCGAELQVIRWSKASQLWASGLLILSLSALTTWRAYEWGDDARLAYSTARDHPNSARSLYEAGRMALYEAELKGNNAGSRIQARDYFQRALPLDPVSEYASAGIIFTYSGAEAVPAAAVADFESRLRKIPTFHLGTFQPVLNAVIKGELVLSASDVENLVSAALDNPSTDSTQRAQIFNDYGTYQFMRRHDSQAAIGLILAAVAEDPANPRFQINLSRLALALHETDRARAAILRAQELDEAGLFDKEIAAVKAQLGLVH